MATPQAQASLASLIQQLFAEMNMPPDVLNGLMGGVKELQRTVVEPGLKVGEKAPDFLLTNQGGKEVSLSKTLGRGPVVLKFYRGAWCPICNVEVSALQRRLPDIEAAGATLLAISPQFPDKSLALVEKHTLGFDALSDPMQQTIRAYRLQFAVPETVKKIYLSRFGLDMEKENADKSWNLPIPATFVLDRKGVIRARHVDVDYTQRMEPDAILAALREV